MIYMNKKNIKISLIMNIVIFIMVSLATFFMFTGIKFMSDTEFLSDTGVTLFKYYTVDSNLFVGVASLLLIIYEILLINKKIKSIPKYVYILKFIGTVAVTLTFMVTLFYLAPTYGSNFFFLYQNANFFYHFLVPIISMISFIYYEKTNLDEKYIKYGLSTMILYGIYYLINVLVHMENGKVSFEYDWYGFASGGVITIIITIVLMLTITYLISKVLFKKNQLK